MIVNNYILLFGGSTIKAGEKRRKKPIINKLANVYYVHPYQFKIRINDWGIGGEGYLEKNGLTVD